MWWMWIVGPSLLVLIWLTTGFRDRRREREVEAWRLTMGPKVAVEKEAAGYRTTKKIGKPPVGPGAKIVNALPGPLQRVIDTAGGGHALGHYELVPKIAFLSSMTANLLTGSDLQAVTGKLEDSAPAFVVRPLPIIEGERIANTGIEFKKDPDFMGLFQVDADVQPPMQIKPGAKAAVALPTEAEIAKKIRGWLSRPVREALRDLPDAWLYVQGRAMALVLYGPADASKLNALVTTADVIFAEYGEDGGPSLFEDDEDDDSVAPAPAPPPPAAKKSKPAAKTAAAKA
ncbi:MAG: hypothetical protein ABJE95_03975 [Byssovorax sp.]